MGIGGVGDVDPLVMKMLTSNKGKILANSNKTCLSIFQKYDTDKSGSLNRQEINEALKDWKLDQMFSSKDLIEEIDSVPEDSEAEEGDGEITFDEIIAYAEEQGVSISDTKKLGNIIGETAGFIQEGTGGGNGFFSLVKNAVKGVSAALKGEDITEA